MYKKLTANDSNSSLDYLNKLVDQYNNTYHHSICKKVINADYSVFTEKFKVKDRVRITKYKNFLVKITLKSGQEKYLLSSLC